MQKLHCRWPSITYYIRLIKILLPGPSVGSIRTAYGTYDLIPVLFTWGNARDFCNLSGGHLAAFETEAEFTVTNFPLLPAISGSDLTRYWIGMNDIATHGSYVWAHNNQPVGNYRPWAPNEPYGNREHCVLITDNVTGEWRDFPCDKKLYFICEYP